jgi:hypothetical protein
MDGKDWRFKLVCVNRKGKSAIIPPDFDFPRVRWDYYQGHGSPKKRV